MASIQWSSRRTEFGVCTAAVSGEQTLALVFTRDKSNSLVLEAVSERLPREYIGRLERQPSDNQRVAEILNLVEQYPAQPQQCYQALQSVISDQQIEQHPLGTDFLKQVWIAMRSVPCGTKVSYSELAQLAGRPKAVRAVATACARNPLAVTVPCHRIVRGDGGLGGYHWGLDVKRRLLLSEGCENSIEKMSHSEMAL